MDPSYNNNGMGNAAGGGNSGVPGVGNTPGVGNVPGAASTSGTVPPKPGVIASGPTVPGATPNTVTNSIPVTPTASTTPGGAPVNSNTTALFGRKFSATNTPPKTPAPVITVPQPMQLNDSANKPKKGLIIGGLVAVVVLIVGLIVGLLMMNGGKGGNNNDATGHNDFLKYANYLLNGTESTNSDLGSFDEEKDYAITTAYIENNREFFNKVDELWQNFYNKVVVDGEYSQAYENDVDLTDNIDYQNELMDFVMKYMDTKILNNEDLLNMYINSGLDGAIAKSKDNYKKMAETSYWLGGDYTKSLMQYAEDTLNLYATYDSHGCIENSEIVDSCILSNIGVLDPVLTQYFEKIQYEDDDFIYYVINELTERSFMINNYFGITDDEN